VFAGRLAWPGECTASSIVDCARQHVWRQV
jgi:hypothetical protein